MHDATFPLELRGGIDPLQMAYAGYLGGYHGLTFLSYERGLKLFITWCFQHDLHPLENVKRAHVEFYVRDLVAQGLAPSTISTLMTPVKGFYDLAVWDEYIQRDPARRVTLPKVRHTKPKPVSQRDLVLFVETARDTSPRHWALVTLLHSMGLRISEAASLRIEGYTSWADSGSRDVQAFARHADPRTTSKHYDLGSGNDYKHPVHQIAARLAV